MHERDSVTIRPVLLFIIELSQHVTFRVSWVFCRYCPTICPTRMFQRNHSSSSMVVPRSRSWTSGVLHLLPYSVAGSRSVTTTTYMDEWIFILQRQDIVLVRFVLPFPQRRSTRCSPTHAAMRADRRFPIQRPFSLYSCFAFMCPNALFVCDSRPRGKKNQRDPSGRRHPLEARLSSPAIPWRQGRRPLGTNVGRLRSNLSSSPSLQDGYCPMGKKLVSPI
jgi:hypothetical protein